MALPVKALKAGQEAYWLDQITRNREEYFSGAASHQAGSSASRRSQRLGGVASAEQVRAMFQGLDPATGQVRCQPLWRADPRSKLAAGPLLEALKARAAEHGAAELEVLAGSKALKGDVRSVESACRLGGARRVKVETVERLSRRCWAWLPRTHAVGTPVAGVREATGYCSERQIVVDAGMAIDTGLATCAGHQPSAERS